MPKPPLLRYSPRRTLTHRKRKRLLLITDLPDEILTQIINSVLGTRVSGQVSQRGIARFRNRGRTVAQLSRRFNSLLRTSITSISIGANDEQWAKSMVVFARNSLNTLHLSSCFPRRRSSPASLCMRIADARPPLREISLANFGVAPFEHVVAMLRALSLLSDIHLHYPRPMDVAAVARACQSLNMFSLGSVAHEKEVDEMRRQFVNFVCSPAAKTLKTLTIPWSCATTDAFVKIGTNCTELEKFGAEFGAMHWIRHRAYKAMAPLEVDLCACAREQRSLFRSMLRAVSARGTLKSLDVRTMDRIPAVDLDLVFSSLEGLQELDVVIGSTSKPLAFSHRSFNLLKTSLSPSLRRLNIVGVGFLADQVVELSTHFPRLTALSVWMAENQRPPVEVFEKFGKRLKHMSVLCEWTEEMCKVVGKHNTCLESLFMVSRELPLSAITSVVKGVGSTLTEFRLFLNRKNDSPPPDGNEEAALEAAAANAAAKAEALTFVNDAARHVVRACATSLEVLSISASRNGKWFVNCCDISSELRRTAPHLWQVCDVEDVKGDL